LDLYLAKRKRTMRNCRQILLVGSDDRLRMIYDALEKQRSWGHQIIGYIGSEDNPENIETLPVAMLGTMSDLEEILISRSIDELIFVLPQDSSSNIRNYLEICEKMGVAVRIVPDGYRPGSFSIWVESIQQIPTICYYNTKISGSGVFYKRVLDLIGGLLGCAVLVVFYPFIAIAIKLDSPGPVIFKQTRGGKNGRLFRLHKFRSMYVDAEERKKVLQSLNVMKGPIFKLADDPRITRVGKILRCTSLDELPQFLNVLKGEMSLVGTRPPTPDEVARYNQRHRRRISIKPGMTGLWQISGRSTTLDFEEIVRIDLQYIDNWRFVRDLKILWKTLGVSFSRRGAC